MKKAPNHFRQSTKSNLKFIWDSLLKGLNEINPWVNLKIMHTNILGDMMAGLVVAIVALPLALAFGVGSGLGAITGIWGAAAGGIIGGIFGGSRVGVSGPTGPKMVQLAAIMVGFQLASGGPDLGAAFTIIFLSGIILVALSFTGISKLIYYTPYSVVAGFMCGIGVIVILLEFDSFLGIRAPHSVVEAIHDIPLAIFNAQPEALMVSIPTLFILFIWPVLGRRVKAINRIPSPLVALLLGTGIANLGGLDIEYIGEIPRGLPDIYLPDWSRFDEFVIPAASLAGLAVFDSLLTCIVADHMIGEKHSSDRETFGQGLANMTAGLVGGLTTATATMRTVANIKSGGKTPLASVFHGIILTCLVLGLGFLAESIPMAVLAAILIKVGIDILDYRIIPVLHRLPLTDMIVFWVVLTVTVVEDLLIAMIVGVVLAFFRFVQQMSKVYKHEVVYLEKMHKDLIADEIKKHIKVLRPQGPLFFGSIEPLEETYHNADNHDVLVIDLGAVPMVDLSGAYALEDLILKAQRDEKDVYICNARHDVEDVLRRIKILDHIGNDSYFNVEKEAIVKAQEMELVKLVHKQILEQTGLVLDDSNKKDRLEGAAAYAHDIARDPNKRKYYQHDEYDKAFTTAVEDYLIGPEIHGFQPGGYTGKKGHLLSCIVTDNYKVDNVKITIISLDNDEIIEKGLANQDDQKSDDWLYTTIRQVESAKGFKIRIEAADLPGNTSSKEFVLK